MVSKPKKAAAGVPHIGATNSNAARAELPRSRLLDANSETVRRKLVGSADALPIQHAVRDKSWRLARMSYLVK